MKSLDIGKALRFPFEDKNWIVKILIGGLLSLVPIVNFLTMGYFLKVLKSSAQDGVLAMPVWEDWGGLFTQGLFSFVISLIYGIVPMLLFFLLVLPFKDAGNAMAIGILGAIITVIVGLCAGVLIPMAFTLFAVSGDFRQAFNFGELFARVGQNVGNYLLAFLVLIGLGIVLGIVYLIPILGFIAAIFGSFYMLLVSAALFGSVYRGTAASAPPAPPAA